MPISDIAVALTPLGAEKVVSNEIKKLGLKVIESAYGRVRFHADLGGLCRALMGLRAADRVLLELGNFNCADFDALFEGVGSLPWEEYLRPPWGLKVAKVRSNRSRLAAETSIQAVVHKAAAQRLCQKRGVRRLEGADEAELRVYVEKDKASVLLDLTGEPLFKRGYRTQGMAAPLRETTAAALVLASGWKRKFPLYDPFCGSGTIPIEAALYAWDIAPGIGRHFSIEGLFPQGRKEIAKAREEFMDRVNFTNRVRIGGSDSQAPSIAAARGNLARALSLCGGTKTTLTFEVCPMEEAAPPWDEEGFIITNPPYGRRLGDPQTAEATYGAMAALREPFARWKMVLICDHPGFESLFGRRADTCRELSNGAIGSYVYQYEAL
ncbi:MAG: class I SAM-dependent RNA methyltransferase [Treponema sp.]|nr:class I SAM-dependent RNA methyltransferase [Treponema sp.]